MHNLNQYEISFGPIEPWIVFEMKRKWLQIKGIGAEIQDNYTLTHTHTHTRLFHSLSLAQSSTWGMMKREPEETVCIKEKRNNQMSAAPQVGEAI